MTVDYLWQNVSSTPGVGKKLASLLNKLHINSNIDLLLYLPINLTTITSRESLTEVALNEVSTVNVIIKAYKNQSKHNFSKKPFQVIAEDKNNNVVLINFFNYYSVACLKKLLPLGATTSITGKFEKFGNYLIINHPEVNNSGIKADIINSSINSPNNQQNITKERTYKTTSGITSKRLGSLIATVLAKLPTLPEWFDFDFMDSLKLPSFSDALNNIHLSNNFELNIEDKNLLRLALDEMLAFQLKLVVAKSKEELAGYSFKDTKNLVKTLYKELPFKLTESQITAIKEIFANLKDNYQMVRLLEGDVGSGKTMVALFGAVLAVSSDYQVVFMVPTESLALQHFNTFKQYSTNLNLKLGLLTGSTKAKERRELLLNLQNQQIDIVIGTHAIFQDDVIFKRLGLIIIDEQHRFGVLQRLKLINKDKAPHILMLSATPIPRTLALTNYGHISVSRLLQKPKNRKPIITKSILSNKIDSALQRVKQKVLDGQKVFWICPLIEENEKLNYTAALVRYRSFSKYLDNTTVWLLHGKLTAAEKANALASFKNAASGVLVSTTVVEVGIDIPDANIMVIEHAERFGLAQLHQLRGRVGRGDANAYCLLIFDTSSSSISSKKRMEIMESSNDGFYIAEKDFELRGSGNILGTRQSGTTPFKIATLELQNQYMKAIANYAKYLYLKQPQKYLEYGAILNKIFHFNIKDFSFFEVFNNG